MNFSIFTLTNSRSIRGENFINNSIKKNNLVFDIMSENKHKHLYLNFLIYIIFFPIIIIFFIVKFFIYKQKTIIVLFPGVLELFLLKILNIKRSKKIGYDFFTSFYLTLVEDRKKFSGNSIASRILIFIDRLIFKMSDFQFVESQEMLNYLKKNLDINTQHTYVLPTPRPIYKQEDYSPDNNYCQLLFWGNFAEMHGIEYILDCAKHLSSEKYIFDLIGDGPLMNNIKKRVKNEQIDNVRLLGYLPFYDPKSTNDVVANILRADICLGTFSNSIKNNLIIPHKIIEAMSFSKPIITADSIFIKNNLSEIVRGVPPENGKKLADDIEELFNDKNLMNELSQKGNKFFHDNFSEMSFKKKLTGLVI